MKIKTYIDLTPAQEKTINDFQNCEVRTSLAKPTVVVTFRTFLLQDVKVTIDALGFIHHVTVVEEVHNDKPRA